MISEEDFLVAQDFLLSQGIDARMIVDLRGELSLGIWNTQYARRAYIEARGMHIGPGRYTGHVRLRVLSPTGGFFTAAYERTYLYDSPLEAARVYVTATPTGTTNLEAVQPLQVVRFLDDPTVAGALSGAEVLALTSTPTRNALTALRATSSNLMWGVQRPQVEPYVEVVCQDVPRSFYRTPDRTRVDPFMLVRYFGTEIFAGHGELYDKLTNWLPQFQEQEEAQRA